MPAPAQQQRDQPPPRRHRTARRRVFVRDLGSQIGTIVNDRVLHNRGGRGVPRRPARRSRSSSSPSRISAPRPTEPAETPASNDGSLSGLFRRMPTDASADTTIMTLPEFADSPDSIPAPTSPASPAHAGETHDSRAKRPRLMTFQDIDDVAVITFRIAEMSEESVISAVRVELENILDQPGSRPDGHSLRPRQSAFPGRRRDVPGPCSAYGPDPGDDAVLPRLSPVMEFLEKTQLPLLIEIYSTLEEALSTPWITGNQQRDRDALGRVVNSWASISGLVAMSGAMPTASWVWHPGICLFCQAFPAIVYTAQGLPARLNVIPLPAAMRHASRSRPRAIPSATAVESSKCRALEEMPAYPVTRSQETAEILESRSIRAVSVRLQGPDRGVGVERLGPAGRGGPSQLGQEPGQIRRHGARWPWPQNRPGRSRDRR